VGKKSKKPFPGQTKKITTECGSAKRKLRGHLKSKDQVTIPVTRKSPEASGNRDFWVNYTENHTVYIKGVERNVVLSVCAGANVEDPTQKNTADSPTKRGGRNW